MTVADAVGTGKHASRFPEPVLIDVSEAVAMFWRNRFLIVAWGVIAALVSFVVQEHLGPSYKARTDVMLNTRNVQVLDMASVVEALPLDGPAIDSERAVLKSPQLLGQVITALHLHRDPEFNTALATPPFHRRLATQVIAALPDNMRALFQTAAPSVRQPDQDIHLSVLRRLDAAVKVERVGLSVVLRITASSTDPVKAALIANTIAARYIARQRESKMAETAAASEWLDTRLRDLQSRLSESESAVAAFRAKAANTLGDDVTTTNRRIGELSEKLKGLDMALESDSRRLSILRETLGSQDVVDASRTLDLSQLTPLLAEIDRLKIQLTPSSDHANARAIATANDRVTTALVREEQRLLRARKKQLAQRSALATSRDTLISLAKAQSENAVQLRQLEQEAAASRLIYETFLARFKETTGQMGLQKADARLIATAQPAASPSGPGKALVMTGAGLSGMALAYAFLALSAAMSSTLASPGDVRRATGLSELARIPLQPRRMRRRQDLLAYLRRRPNSGLAEAARKLRAVVQPGGTTRGGVVLLTSALPNEGKTSCAIMLAQSAAQAGKAVILVDADLRRPSLHRALRLAPRADLISVLHGSCELGEALSPVTGESFRVLPVFQKAGDLADLLVSERMSDLVNTLRESADLVIIDAPPVLPVSDPASLAPLCDQVLLTQRWNVTTSAELRQAVVELRGTGAKIRGIVTTMVDPQRDWSGESYAALSSYYIN